MAYNFSDLIVFEMANNHQGDVTHGLRIIEEMAKITNDWQLRAAVKLQYRQIETFIHPAYTNREDVMHIPRFMGTRLTPDEFHSLVKAIKSSGMLAVVTPFDEPSVDMCLDHGADILKVASCSCMDWPLLEKIAKAGNPVICSTGGCRISDIDKVVTFFEHRMHTSDLALLHCIGMYPTQDADQQLHLMRRMIDRYPHCAVGYSGHESPDNLHVVTAAVAMGAKILERHVGVPTDTIKLNSYSMAPQETVKWVKATIHARSMCGKYGDERRTDVTESASLRSLARGVWAKGEIKAGERISRDKVFFAMPVQQGQTTAKDYSENLIASQDYEPNQPIYDTRPMDNVRITRDILHEGKGMLREAGIAVGPEYEIEMSHHYGIEHFRKVGAIIINFFNRQYCKKLIIVLPGQQHPSHCHTLKEETFQVLDGELDVIVDGEPRRLRAGEMQLVRRGQYHSFSTKTGCIFEEISTTHQRGDSVYEDPKIKNLDPMERKTILQDW